MDKYDKQMDCIEERHRQNIGDKFDAKEQVLISIQLHNLLAERFSIYENDPIKKEGIAAYDNNMYVSRCPYEVQDTDEESGDSTRLVCGWYCAASKDLFQKFH